MLFFKPGGASNEILTEFSSKLEGMLSCGSLVSSNLNPGFPSIPSFSPKTPSNFGIQCVYKCKF